MAKERQTTVECQLLGGAGMKLLKPLARSWATGKCMVPEEGNVLRGFKTQVAATC